MLNSLAHHCRGLAVISSRHLYKNVGNKSVMPQAHQFWQNRTYAANQMTASVAQLSLNPDMCADPPFRALILGVFANENDKSDVGVLTPMAWRFNVTRTNGRLLEVLRLLGQMPKRGQVRILYAIEPEKFPYYTAVAVVGLGQECIGYNAYEVIDEQKEAIRRSVGAAALQLAELNAVRIDVDNCGHAESAAEGAAMGIWLYQELRDPQTRLFVPVLDLFTYKDETCDLEGWRIGLQKAAAQNLTRQLQEMPSNLLTPTAFAQTVVEVLCKSGVNVEVKVEGWAESQSMYSFLSVARASCEPPIFLELSYYGTSADERPIVLVGQGVTYDSGGLCINDIENLKIGRGGMTGAAIVVAACRAIASLRLPVNIRGLIALCDNTIGCNAFRPGDIVKAMNGKSVEIINTDFEEVLVLCDALLYSQNFCPKFVLDLGTVRPQMKNILDEAACGVFTNSEILWQQIKHASMHTGDRVWRMPLWNYYTQQVTSWETSDLQNTGIGRGGQPCCAAAFLRQFVPCGQWIHIDVSNVMITGGEYEYLRPGMAGRPTRTIVEFIAQTICKDTAPKRKPVKF